MPAVTMPANQKGDFLVDYETKVFEDIKAAPGEKETALRGVGAIANVGGKPIFPVPSATLAAT